MNRVNGERHYLICALILYEYVVVAAALGVPRSLWISQPCHRHTVTISSDRFRATNGFGDEDDSLNGSPAGDLKGKIATQYDSDTLASILNAHNNLMSEIAEIEKEEEVEAPDKRPSVSLHDLILQTIEGGVDESRDDRSKGEGDTLKILLQKASSIRAIASDVDGTLLTSEQDLHPRTRNGLQRAIKSVASANLDPRKSGGQLMHFFIATGKSQKGALDSLGEEIAGLILDNNIPGVYLQGLFCVDGRGKVLFERKLSAKAVSVAEKLAKENDISIVSYDGDDLYTTKVTADVRHLHEFYGEPMPKLLPDGAPLASHELSMHKILLMDNNVEKLQNVRPELEKLATKYEATVTQAIPTMLEFLPGGCSKGKGVAAVCRALGIVAEKELLALGDAENDVGMLEMAAIGVAVGNASCPARKAADYIMKETNNEGAAGIAMDVFVFDR